MLDALSPFVRQVVGLPHKWGIPRAVTIGHTACYANVSVSCKEMDTFSKYQNDSGQAGATAPSSSPVFTHCAGTPRSAAEGVSPVPGQSPYQSHSKPILAPAHTTRPSEQRVTIAWGNALLSRGATRCGRVSAGTCPRGGNHDDEKEAILFAYCSFFRNFASAKTYVTCLTLAHIGGGDSRDAQHS